MIGLEHGPLNADDKCQPAIRDLAIIGDRRTAAVIDGNGRILWYCPGRFDRPSLFAGLIDSEGGSWRFDLPGAHPAGRHYIGNSGALETRLRVGNRDWVVTDFMPTGRDMPSGLLCRLFSGAPDDARIELIPRPDYAREGARLTCAENTIVINERQHLYASHPLVITGSTISMRLPKGAEGWQVLADAPIALPVRADLDGWLSATRARWETLFRNAPDEGPYQREVIASLRALRMLCHEETGGIIAAATTSLPETPGGSGNWDYRYVWLRDTGMIVSALTRLDDDLAEGERYLDFICSAQGSSSKYPVAVFTSLDHDAAPREQTLDLAGYCQSRPVRIGNNARDQMQLDAFANVLLAAKLIYQRSERRSHWNTVAEIANFLTENWREPDHGMWEEQVRRQYTAGKVISACALDSVAEFSTDQRHADRWRAAVREIREFVATYCLTPAGAYAVFAGSKNVDVSAALFPVWAYTDADTPEMRATMEALETDYSWRGLLYWRHLEGTDSRKEGAFLAGTFWVAQYWIMRGDLERARAILDSAIACSNDLGLFAEEADPSSRRMLGNIPQAFVHAAFIGAVIDLRNAIRQQPHV